MGLFDFFSKKDNSKDVQPRTTEKMTLEKLCEILPSSEQINVLKTLNLPLAGFTKATQDQINSNPDDKRAGVIEVYIATYINLFGVFDKCVHKIYKNGNKQFFFYTTTNNSEVISNFANILYEKLGEGIFDNSKYNSFRHFDNIDNIAKGFCSSGSDECDTMWPLENNMTVWLQYHVNPLKQFVFQILQSQPIERINNPRTESILKYAKFDLNKLIENSSEFEKVVEDDNIKYIDYFLNLPEPFLEIFDLIKIRIFGDKKVFDKNTQTHLFFSSTRSVLTIDSIIKVTKSIVSIYGKDDTYLDNLQDFEITKIKESGYWLGRRYSFNKDHKIWDSKNPNDSVLYNVDLCYDINTEGLILSIIGFNELVKLIEK